MEKSQNLYIKANDSEYLHNIIEKNDWEKLIELASEKNINKNLLYYFFQTEESKSVLKIMSEEQILKLFDACPLKISENILLRMESLCESDSKFSNIGLKLTTEIYSHGGDLNCSLIVKCLPSKILREIIDSRIPYNKFQFGPNKQEFLMKILASNNDEKNVYHYRYLKEEECSNLIYIYISEEIESFPLGRRDVLKELVHSLRDAFSYIESNENIRTDSVLISRIVDPIYFIIIRSLQSKIYDYKNDVEIVELLREVFNEFYYSKFFLSKILMPILNGTGNNGLLIDSKLLEKCNIITPTFYYKVFKRAVEENKCNFVNQVSKVLLSSSSIFRFMRELDDGIYDILFKSAIDMSVKEIIERKWSDNFAFCCNLLNYRPECKIDISTQFVPKFDECISFITSVITKIFEKKESLNVDCSSYPQICLYILNTLNGIKSDKCDICCCDTFIKFQNKPIHLLFNDINEFSHKPLDFLDNEMRNKLVLGCIKHPVDSTKFSSIITSNNPTFLVKFACYLSSVRDLKLILSEEKRDKVDQFGFIECKSESNESFKMNIIEVFLKTLKFWVNNDKNIFKDGYTAYYQFARKILIESIKTNDKELKKAAISVYHRYAETVSLMKNARCMKCRIHIASLTFLTPLSVIVGSEIDKNFVENFVNKYIKPFNSLSYQSILSEVLSRSHLDLNYYEDEQIEDNELDRIFQNINLDDQYVIAFKLLLELIKENPVKTFHLYYSDNLKDDFFISDKRMINNIKKRFEILNPKIKDLCNPLKTEYPLPMELNSPKIDHINLKSPQYKLSSFVFLEMAKFIDNEYKNYSPKLFKTKSTKQLIKIQTFMKKLIACDTFRFKFTLDEPSIDTNQIQYLDQEKIKINAFYTNSFFNFLNEINNNQKSIFNIESFNIIRRAFMARFLSKDDFTNLGNKVPPKFTGFNIIIEFQRHPNADNIFSIMNYKTLIKEYQFNSYKKARHINSQLIKFINQNYNVTKMIENNPFNDAFNVNMANHRNKENIYSEKTANYPKNIHKCFTKIMNALNKSKAELFVNDYESLERLITFKPIKKCASDSDQYEMLTNLLDLLIKNFVLSKNDLAKACKNSVITFDDIYRYMNIVSKIASPNIGKLSNLHLICQLKENEVNEKVVQNNPKLFLNIIKCGNIEQILTCMNSYLFASNACLFPKYLLESGHIRAQELFGSIINEILNNKIQILDAFHVSLAKCIIFPRFVGFPAPKSSLDYLKLIATTSKSISVKRAACANAVYYAIMNSICGKEIPFNDINEIIESAHKKSKDEITAFFCLLISKEVSINKMNSLPGLHDLMNENALPESFIFNQGPKIILPKEIGEIYYNCIEKVILSGLKSNKFYIYKLVVTVLNEINVGSDILRIISPFVENGLREIKPNDDNEAFIKYATSFTMKNNEFPECFSAYCEALTTIKKHSYNLLANTQINKDSPYPESFSKLGNLFNIIANTIEKPFIEFKDEKDMISVSLFCSKLLPVLKQNRPAISLDIFLHLEGVVSIFGDELIKEVVHLYKQDNKEESLSKFIALITHHNELIFNIPRSLNEIYNHIKSAFSIKHTIELSKNLSISSMNIQRDYNLAYIISNEVLEHIPNEESIKKEKEKGVDLGINSEDEIIEVLSNLDVFCKNRILFLNPEIFPKPPQVGCNKFEPKRKLPPKPIKVEFHSNTRSLPKRRNIEAKVELEETVHENTKERATCIGDATYKSCDENHMEDKECKDIGEIASEKESEVEVIENDILENEMSAGINEEINNSQSESFDLEEEETGIDDINGDESIGKGGFEIEGFNEQIKDAFDLFIYLINKYLL